MKLSKFQGDVLERCARTFLAVCLSTAAAGVAGVVDLNSAKALGLASLTAAVSAVISSFATFVGDPTSASFIDHGTA